MPVRPRHRILPWICALALGLGATTQHAGAQPKDDKPADGADADGDDGELYRCKNLPKNAKFKVTLKPETDLKELVNWAMSFTCRNFIFGQGILGRSSKVTIIAPQEMTPGEAWNLFLVALQTMNLNVVPKGKTLEIIEAPGAKEKPLPVYKGRGAPNSDQIVRVVIRPENMGVDDATQVLNSLKSRDGIIVPLPNVGVVIVTDYGNVIDKMLDVMNAVDDPADGEKVFIIRIHNADAVTLAQKLNEIFGSKAGGGAPAQPARPQSKQPTTKQPGKGADVTVAAAVPSKIIADERTNSLIIVSTEAAYARILALVRKLDAPGEGGDGAIHVYYLENADAEEMSNTLGSLISGTQQQQGGGRGGRGQPAPQGGQQPAASSAGGVAFEGNVRLTFDKPTNSLVVVSSDRDFIALREVIRKLDVPRRQVFVEATILEVSVDRTRRMGLSFHGGVPYTVAGEESLIVGGVQHSELGTVQINLASFLGGAGGLIGPELPESQQILGVSIPSFGVLFQLLQNSNDVNVLSSPHILTTDNVPAEISVGQNIPFQSGSFGIPGVSGGATGGAAGGFGFGTSVQRQDIALKLKITPHVNESDMVRLEIEQEISDVASENFANLGPSWTKRTVKTTVVVKDQQPVVIGGLMQDKTLISESKVPLIGDIPIVGYLFKYQRKTKTKTNLLIFLTPYVIKDQADIRRIFQKKVRERKEFLRAYSAFSDEADYEPDIDYSRKTGVVEDINQKVRQADEDELMWREAETTKQGGMDGPVELPPDEEEVLPEGGDEPIIEPEPPPQPDGKKKGKNRP